MGERDKKPGKPVKQVPAVPKKFHLRMRVLDYHGKPLPEKTQCHLDWSTIKKHNPILLTDANGVVDFTIPDTTHSKPVWILEVQAFPNAFYQIVLLRQARQTGDSVPGARMRLNNLGYLALKNTAKLDAPMDDVMQRGVERFQAANRILDKTNLPVNNTLGVPSGKLDAQTKARLEEAHDTDTGDLLK